MNTLYIWFLAITVYTEFVWEVIETYNVEVIFEVVSDLVSYFYFYRQNSSWEIY